MTKWTNKTFQQERLLKPRLRNRTLCFDKIVIAVSRSPEQSEGEAKQSKPLIIGDCFVTSFLAKTIVQQIIFLLRNLG